MDFLKNFNQSLTRYIPPCSVQFGLRFWWAVPFPWGQRDFVFAHPRVHHRARSRLRRRRDNGLECLERNKSHAPDRSFAPPKPHWSKNPTPNQTREHNGSVIVVRNSFVLRHAVFLFIGVFICLEYWKCPIFSKTEFQKFGTFWQTSTSKFTRKAQRLFS